MRSKWRLCFRFKGNLSSGSLYLNWNDASGIGSIQVSTEVQLEISVRPRVAM